MAEYYLAGTLKPEQKAATYYMVAEAREKRAADFWRGAIREGHPSRRTWPQDSASQILPHAHPSRYCEVVNYNTN